MATVLVSFEAYAYGYVAQYHLYITTNVNGEIIHRKTTSADEVSYLINRYSSKIEAVGYGYRAEMPENVAQATVYLTYTKRASREELEEIVKTGITRLHRFLESIGFLIEPFKNIPNSFEKGGYSMSIVNFPTLALSHDGERIAVKLREGEVDTKFIKRLIEGGASEAEVEMLRGISLLKGKTQRKFLRTLSMGELSMEELASAMFRSAVSSRDEYQWKGVVKWLENNGYKERASEIIVKKTLCS